MFFFPFLSSLPFSLLPVPLWSVLPPCHAGPPPTLTHDVKPGTPDTGDPSLYEFPLCLPLPHCHPHLPLPFPFPLPSYLTALIFSHSATSFPSPYLSLCIILPTYFISSSIPFTFYLHFIDLHPTPLSSFLLPSFPVSQFSFIPCMEHRICAYSVHTYSHDLVLRFITCRMDGQLDNLQVSSKQCITCIGWLGGIRFPFSNRE